MQCIRCRREMGVSEALYCPLCGAKQERKTARRKRANGEGYVYKRGNKWTVMVTLGFEKTQDGKLHRMTISKGGFSSAKDAAAYADTLRNKKPTEGKTLTQYWQAWSKDDMLKLSESKQTAYKIAWKKVGKLGRVDITTISLEQLRSLVASKCKTYYTARDMKSLLKRLYALADADGIGNPRLPSYINLPKLDEKEGQPFTDEQLKRLWQSYEAGNTMAGYALLMIYTGMMPGQLLALRKDQIDYDNRQIVGAGMKTKVRKATPISLSELIVPVLRDLCAKNMKSKKVVPMNKDKFYSEFKLLVQQVSGRDLTPYSCRHTTATALAVGENIAPQIIRKVMRWTSTKMLSRYAHPDMQDALAAVNSIRK